MRSMLRCRPPTRARCYYRHPERTAGGLASYVYAGARVARRSSPEPQTAPPGPRTLGYASVPQEEESDVLVRQTEAIVGQAAARDCELVEVARERAGLSCVIERLAAGTPRACW